MIKKIKTKIYYTKIAIKAIWCCRGAAEQLCKHSVEKCNNFGAKLKCEKCNTLFYDRA